VVTLSLHPPGKAVSGPAPTCFGSEASRIRLIQIMTRALGASGRSLENGWAPCLWVNLQWDGVAAWRLPQEWMIFVWIVDGRVNAGGERWVQAPACRRPANRWRMPPMPHRFL